MVITVAYFQVGLSWFEEKAEPMFKIEGVSDLETTLSAGIERILHSPWDGSVSPLPG